MTVCFRGFYKYISTANVIHMKPAYCMNLASQTDYFSAIDQTEWNSNWWLLYACIHAR